MAFHCWFVGTQIGLAIRGSVWNNTHTHWLNILLAYSRPKSVIGWLFWWRWLTISLYNGYSALNFLKLCFDYFNPRRAKVDPHSCHLFNQRLTDLKSTMVCLIWLSCDILFSVDLYFLFILIDCLWLACIVNYFSFIIYAGVSYIIIMAIV